MKSNSQLKFNYGKTDILGRPKLTSITLSGVDYSIIEQGKTRFIPGLSSIIQFKNNVSFSSDFQPALTGALRANDIGPIVRGSVAKAMREKLGISLIAWNLSKFKSKDSKAARIEQTRERIQKVDESGAGTTPNNATTDKLSEAIDEADQAEKEALTSDKAIQETIDNGGVMKSVQSALNNAIKKSGFTTALGVANQAYGALMPLCIVYDGSLDRSGPTIDKQVTQQRSTYYYVASGAGQQQRGTLSTDPAAATELAVATNATNADLASTEPDNAQIKASGYQPDTSKTLGAEQSAGGSYTLLNALLGSNAVADTLNSVAGGVCSFVTNTQVAIGGAILNIGIGIVSLGTSAAAEEAAGKQPHRLLLRKGKVLPKIL